MCKISELQLSDDHKSVLVDGVWIELQRKIEDFAFITPRCEGCPKGTFLSCIQFDGVDRRANCEMLDGVKLFEDMSANPQPQPGKMWEEYQKKHAPPDPVVVEQPAPDPAPKASFLEKVKSFIG